MFQPREPPSRLIRKRWPWTPRKFFLICAALLTVGAIIERFSDHGLRRDIRYQADGSWNVPGEFKVIGDSTIPRYSAVAGGAGFASDGSWFRVVGSSLQMGTNPNGPATTEFALPSGLLDSHAWKVVVSADARRVIVVNERGMAVWRATPSHELMHSWAATTEPMAGEKVGEFRDGNTSYDQNELTVSYEVSPDGRLACVHAVKQSGFRHDRPRIDGVVIIRDLEAGKDVAQLVHADSGAVIDLVAWSRDGRRLATFAGKTELLTVWDVAETKPMIQFKENAEIIALSADGSLVYSAFTGKFSGGYSGPDRPRVVAHRVADGSIAASRKLACNELLISPDGKQLAACWHDRLEILDGVSLATVWSSTFDCCAVDMQYRPDGAEIAVVTLNVAGLVAVAGVKAWDATDGTILLDCATNAGGGSTRGVGFASDGDIWTFGPSHGNSFKPMVLKTPVSASE